MANAHHFQDLVARLARNTFNLNGLLAIFSARRRIKPSIIMNLAGSSGTDLTLRRPTPGIHIALPPKEGTPIQFFRSLFSPKWNSRQWSGPALFCCDPPSISRQ
jgi:hypothetical protein